jgi:hypothetical protein
MDQSIEVTLPRHGRVTLTRARLPDTFLIWQSKARISMFEMMDSQGANSVRTAPVHLPVLASVGDGIFPINLTTRGIGVLPKEEYIAEFTERFQNAKVHVDRSEYWKSLAERVRHARDFYKNHESFDPYILGGLEIFEGQTPKNLMKNPVASLLYTGEAPDFSSYQLNGIIEFIKPENPSYEFLLAARELFAFDHFHVTQHSYPYGYLFHVIEVKEKTPFTRK